MQWERTEVKVEHDVCPEYLLQLAELTGLNGCVHCHVSVSAKHVLVCSIQTDNQSSHSEQLVYQ